MEDERIRIRPLGAEDYHALFEISSDPLLWEQHPAKERSTPEGFRKWFDDAMATGKALFIEEKSTGKPIGTSRYKEVEDDPETLEIGWTFIARAFWGNGYNGVIKRLMMQHAFTEYQRIFFFVDKQNFRSQKAVEKIGGRRIPESSPVLRQSRAEKSFIYFITKPTDQIGLPAVRE